MTVAVRLAMVAVMLSAGCGEPERNADGRSTGWEAPDASRPADDASAPPPRSLDPGPGTYQGSCDGSGAVALGFDHFLDVNDEDQSVRVYRRGATGMPVAQVDVSGAIGLGGADEADFEDAARSGDRVYVVSSHGRDKKGVLQPARYRFVALAVSGPAESASVQVAGWSATLLPDLLDPASWATPDAALIALLGKSSQLDKPSDANLAPEVGGTNIEALAALPSSSQPRRLVIGFRNPQSGADAILVTLLNPDALAGGAKARLGEAFRFDLGGLGLRGMTWSRTHDALLLLAGPADGGPGFRVYKWSGDAATAPVPVADLAPPADYSPEAIVAYDGTVDVQILFDMGDRTIGGTSCKKSAAAQKSFTDQILHIAP